MLLIYCMLGAKNPRIHVGQALFLPLSKTCCCCTWELSILSLGQLQTWKSTCSRKAAGHFVSLLSDLVWGNVLVPWLILHATSIIVIRVVIALLEVPCMNTSKVTQCIVIASSVTGFLLFSSISCEFQVETCADSEEQPEACIWFLWVFEPWTILFLLLYRALEVPFFVIENSLWDYRYKVGFCRNGYDFAVTLI
jgi:hypothetical protein